jgi:hypothetical protein
VKPLVYVAGPITGDPWGCVRKATHVAAALNDFGCWAYLPQLSVLHEIVAPEPYEHWIELGLAMVARCDGLWRIPGVSPGADREVEHADRLGLPVFEGGGNDALKVWRTAVQKRAEKPAGITLRYAHGEEQWLPGDWDVNVEHETRDARPDDPEWNDTYNVTVATGKRTTTARITTYSEKYRP